MFQLFLLQPLHLFIQNQIIRTFVEICMDAIPPHYNLINKKQIVRAPCTSRSLISARYESLISRADRNADVVAGSHFTIQTYRILIGSDDRNADAFIPYLNARLVS